MSEFKIGDRVKCIEPGYSFRGKLGTIMSQKGDLFKVEIDGMDARHYLHFAEDMELADPLLTAAKALLTFLEDRSTCEICTGGNSEDPEIFEFFDRYDLVAYPDKELTKAIEGLREAIEGVK